MGSFITDLKAQFSRGNLAVRFIFVTTGVFLVFSFMKVFCMLFQVDYSWIRLLALPSNVDYFLMQPWTLLTYMLMHADAWHLLFNMLWLYWFGNMFLSSFSEKHFRGLYILGGIAGGLFAILCFQVIPYFRDSLPIMLVGASASVLAIAVATTMRRPDENVRLFLFGSLKLRYLIFVMIALDLLFLTSSNGGGHLAHLGGAFMGWLFVKCLEKGYDLTRGINWVIDSLSDIIALKKRIRKPKMKVSRGGKQQHTSAPQQTKTDNGDIEQILAKLKQSGYASLTTEEKKRLFDASKR